MQQINMSGTLLALRSIIFLAWTVSSLSVTAQDTLRRIHYRTLKEIRVELQEYDMLKERYRFLQKDYQDLQVIVSDQRGNLENQEKLLLKRGKELIQLQESLSVALKISQEHELKAKRYKRQRNHFAVVLGVAITTQLLRDILEW